MRHRLDWRGTLDKKIPCPRCGSVSEPKIAAGVTTWEDWGDEYNAFPKERLYCPVCEQYLGELSD